MKKTFIALIVLFVLVNVSTSFASPQLNIRAVSAILVDDATGKILYSKNDMALMAPASTTKIMTAVLALEHLNPNQLITISSNAASKEGTSMGLKPNERRTVKDLLFGLLLVSGNDAATALAEAISGSEDNFARLMNEKAQSIGMKNTVYKNASGLPVIGHYTTAYDMALLTRYAFKVPGFAQIVSTKCKDVPGSIQGKVRHLKNHNKLLWKYPYANGVKTGYTFTAGGCLVSSACQNGERLITVVLKTNAIYEDTINLFDYGFATGAKS